MYGAGSIGRGFIGQLFNMSGLRTCFIDVDKNIVRELSGKNKYTIKIAEATGFESRVIDNVTAVNGFDSGGVAEVISKCRIMATAVGVNILPLIAKNIAAGLDLRSKFSGNPLDIIVCENISDGGNHLKELVLEHSSDKEYVEKNIGFVSASVGRMVPVSESTGIVVEAYNELPVDRDALKTDISAIYNVIPVSPFAIEKYKKYFMHNMSHAIVAYLGFIKGHEYIWQAVSDNFIRNITELALQESIEAISEHFNVSYNELSLYGKDLLDRYRNKYLGDRVLRVGRDPLRKLGKDDRLVGAASFCMENGVNPQYILYGIAAALYFNPSDDISAPVLQNFISETGIAAALSEFSDLSEESCLSERIIEIYKELSVL